MSVLDATPIIIILLTVLFSVIGYLYAKDHDRINNKFENHDDRLEKLERDETVKEVLRIVQTLEERL